VLHFGKPVLDSVLLAAHFEHVRHVTRRRTTGVSLREGELDTIVGEHGVDLVGDRLDQGREEGRRRGPARLLDDLRWRGARRAGLNAEQAADAVGVPRATLYRWEKAPVSKSRRPHRMRRKNWSAALRAEVERLRLDFPMWGKEKLGPILRDQGFAVSNATTGRIIESLIARGRVPRVRDLIRKATRKAAPKKRLHAIRKPRHVSFDKPGDVIQIDTVTVTLAPNLAVKHFDAYDVHAKWTVAKPYRNATSQNAADFLDKVTAEMPWPI
jgi:hypothetical protein